MRRGDCAFAEQHAGCVDGAVLAPEAFVLHYFSSGLRRSGCCGSTSDLISSPDRFRTAPGAAGRIRMAGAMVERRP